MKEISLETKQKIFALYWGQKVLMNKDYGNGIMHVGFHNAAYDYSKIHLYLTPLSDITDEDLEAISFNFPSGTEGIEFDFQFNNYKFHWKAKKGIYINEGYLTLKDFDYLRSKGYALPYLDWSIEDLVSAGVFKLKTSTNE